MITDPWFYAVAVPAVLLFGISKGGFGGGLGVAAVPLMALVISPLQAAAIMLPILCVMDIVAVSFALHFWISKYRDRDAVPRNCPQSFGWLAGSVAGFTSFVAHSGGPPFSMYLLRRPLNRTVFAATSSVFLPSSTTSN